MGRRARPAALALLLALSGCGVFKGSGEHRVVLDGRPRFADVEGIVGAVTSRSITLVGRGTYQVSPTVQSFSSETMATVPLLQRLGQYVQLGLDGHTAVWVAAIGAVFSGHPPVVYYQGTIVTVDRQRRAIFRDGTVLRVAAGLSTPGSGLARAEIDADRHVVVDFTAL